MKKNSIPFSEYGINPVIGIVLGTVIVTVTIVEKIKKG